jgi:hypothetical protein
MRCSIPIILLSSAASPLLAIELNSWLVVSGSVNGPTGVALPHATLQLCPLQSGPLPAASDPGSCLKANSVKQSAPHARFA